MHSSRVNGGIAVQAFSTSDWCFHNAAKCQVMAIINVIHCVLVIAANTQDERHRGTIKSIENALQFLGRVVISFALPSENKSLFDIFT